MRVRTHKNIKYFQSNLLIDHHFIHAFFTKRYKKNEPRELENELNLTSNIHYLKQVHSNKIIQINNTFNSKPKIADCLITKEKHQSLWIYTADCIPILIADTNTRTIAACHTGLKGLKKQIIPKTLKKLEAIGSKKENLVFAIGPSIKANNYQINIKDVDQLIIQLTEKKYLGEDHFLLETNNDEVIPLFKKDSAPDKLLFDIQACAILQLYKEGIKKSQINLNRLCTFSNPEIFNSFRRDKTQLRQWSCIYS